MRILAIETSCDETAVSIIEAQGDATAPSFFVRAHRVHSQIETHRPYGGVYPNLAKREHAAHVVPLLASVLMESGNSTPRTTPFDETLITTITKILAREGALADEYLAFAKEQVIQGIDAICVTAGPGLEPALWVGISTAVALGTTFAIPVYPVNHMEGHIVSVLIEQATANNTLQSLNTNTIAFPLLSLLISGGHTELITSTSFTKHTKIGETRDDAVGEAFDKVARIIGLPYPGGPEIGKLAAAFRQTGAQPSITFPRPMIHSGDLDFSFSGLKTAVLYHVKDTELTDTAKAEIACAFEDAVADVLVAKVRHALHETQAQTLIIAGGVAANTYIKERFAACIESEFPAVSLLVPQKELATDNSIMIGVAGYFEILNNPIPPAGITADGNWSLGSKNA